MPTPKKGARLGAGPAHQRLMVAGLAAQLFEHGRITTTEAKARVLRPVAEKLITKAKKAELGTTESLHQRRQVLRTIRDKQVVHVLFTEIAPTFAERPGGYTRITKIGPRKGDNAPMAVIELVTEAYAPTARATKPAAGGAPATEAPAEPARSAETADGVRTEDQVDAPAGDQAEDAAGVQPETGTTGSDAEADTDADEAAAGAQQAAAEAEQAAVQADEAAAEAEQAAAKAEQAAEAADEAAEDDKQG